MDPEFDCVLQVDGERVAGHCSLHKFIDVRDSREHLYGRFWSKSPPGHVPSPDDGKGWSAGVVELGSRTERVVVSRPRIVFSRGKQVEFKLNFHVARVADD